MIGKEEMGAESLARPALLRMGHRDRVPASLFQGPPEPVGEVNLPTAFYGAWRAGPISRALSWRGDSEYRAIRVWPQGSSHPREVCRIHSSTIDKPHPPQCQLRRGSCSLL